MMAALTMTTMTTAIVTMMRPKLDLEIVRGPKMKPSKIKRCANRLLKMQKPKSEKTNSQNIWKSARKNKEQKRNKNQTPSKKIPNFVCKFQYIFMYIKQRAVQTFHNKHSNELSTFISGFSHSRCTMCWAIRSDVTFTCTNVCGTKIDEIRHSNLHKSERCRKCEIRK